MDENGYVTDLELAKKLLIEYFTTGDYLWGIYDTRHNIFLDKISNELIYHNEEFTFRNPDGSTYFWAPNKVSGYRLQELSHWVLEHETLDPSNIASMLNNTYKVFYAIDDDVKCFIIHKGVFVK